MHFLHVVDSVSPYSANYTHCGACHEYFHPKEALIALTCHSQISQESVQCWPISRPDAPYFCSDDDGCATGHGPRLRVPTVHRYCLYVFLRACTAPSVPDRLFRLWVATAAKLPWVLKRPLALPAPPADPVLLGRMLAALGVGVFGRLPPEIQGLVLGFLPEGHVVRRVWAVLDQARRLSGCLTVPTEGGDADAGSSTTTVPTTQATTAAMARWTTAPRTQPEYRAWLWSIKLWRRGMTYPRRHQLHLQPREGFVRVSVDACGISKIEYVPESEDPSTGDFRDQLFVFQALESVVGVGAWFMAGHCRLSVPYGATFVLWNNPDPFELSYSVYSPVSGKVEERIYCVNLHSAFGLTLFLVDGLVRAVHSHTATYPTALSTFRTLACPDRCRAIWTYLPLPPCEKIMGYGLREQQGPHAEQIGHFNILIALESRGVICIGRPIVGEVRDMLMLADGRPMMMFNITQRSTIVGTGATRVAEYCVDAIGTYPAFIPDFYEHPCPQRRVPTLYEDLFDSLSSSAPLRGVVAVEVFYAAPRPYRQQEEEEEKERRFCKGLLLTYGDGQQRAVGQCRVGIDRTRRVEGPRAICQKDVWPRRRIEMPGPEHGSVVHFLTEGGALGRRRSCRLSGGRCFHYALEGYAMMRFYPRATRFVIGFLQNAE